MVRQGRDAGAAPRRNAGLYGMGDFVGCSLVEWRRRDQQRLGTGGDCLEFMVAAIRLWLEFFWPHARAALRQIGRSERHANARRVLRWIKAQGKTEVSREEVRRDALGQSSDAEQTQHLLDGLVKAGWLREITTKTPGRTRRRWQVNPLINGTAESAESAERI